MKKLKIFIMSLCVITLGTFLAACNLKQPEATFEKKEVVVSINDSLSFDEFLTVKEIEKKDVSFKLENPDLFDFDGRSAVARKSGKSYVHALYKKNILSSMQIVVRTNFTAPTFSDNPLSSEGVFSWNPVFGYYDNQVISASTYKIEGVCTVYSASDPSVVTETVEIDETVSGTSYKLTQNGVYNLSVKAIGTSYFDDSESSANITLSYGYMQLAKNFAWNEETGVLAWDEDEQAAYALKFDGVESAERFTTSSVNLFEKLSTAAAGDHSVSIIAYDKNGELLATESDTLTIHKLVLPTANYLYNSNNGGKVKISKAQNVAGFDVEFENSESLQTQKLFLANEEQDIITDFEELDAGLYNVKITARAKKVGGLFFQSDCLNFGKVYKLPTATLEGAGSNSYNGTSLALNLDSQANTVDVLLSVNGLGGQTLVEGFAAGETNFNFELNLSEIGSYTIALRQIPVAEQNQIENQNVFVLNSNLTDSVVLTKVDEISGDISHAYADEKSVLTFAKAVFAEKYKLQIKSGYAYVDVSEELYDVNIGEATVEVVLKGRVEDLLDSIVVDDKFIFDLRIVGIATDETLSIGSAKVKQIERLTKPESTGAGNSDKKSYSWQVVDGADGYKLELYQIDKELYDANKAASQINIDTSSLTNIGEEVKINSFSINAVGYYYAKVYALSGDENSYISSEDALEEVFYICEKLEISNVDFGEKNGNYFISISNSENISNYEVFVNDVSVGTPSKTTLDKTEFLISNTFETSGEQNKISVVAHAQNEEIYNASEEYSFVVERLPKVVRGDIQLGELTMGINPEDLSSTNATQYLSINAISGASGVRIWDGSGTSAGSETEKTAKLMVAGKSNFEYNFRYFGSAKNDNIFSMEGKKVYLTGETATFNFTRLQTPTNLAYYDGKLRFDHTGTTSKDYYVLSIVCVGLNKEVQTIVVKLAKTVTVECQNVSEEIGIDSEFVNIAGNVVTIDHERIVNAIKSLQPFANIYNQSEKVGFAVYAFQDRLEGENVTICSQYATANIDNTKLVCVVDKMPQTTLEIDIDSSETDYILKWSPVHVNASYESETKYQVLLNGNSAGEETSALTKSFVKTDFDYSSYYEFSVLVQNPYYLQSDTSNIVRIKVLTPITKLKLFESGKLGYDLGATERDFVDYVKVSTTNSVDNNKTGQIEISGNGKLTLKVIGKKGVEAEGNKKTFYIDSEETKWNFEQMSVLKPADETVRFANNKLSWDAFAVSENLQCLRYVLMFVDENGNKATYKTRQTEEDLTLNKALYNTLDSLSGQVTVYVSAYLETFPESGSSSDEATYTVSAGNTIYYAKDTVLPIGSSASNYYVYSGTAKVNKFETPNITKVDFISTDLSDANLPTMKVEFIGNYGNEREFNIYLNEEFYKSETITLVDGKYSFEISAVDYNSKFSSGETLTIGVCALSQTDILSSTGKVSVYRADEISLVEFVSNAQNEITHTVRFALPEKATSGGVVLKLVYQIEGQEAKEEYLLIPINEVLDTMEYDLTELLNKTEEGKKALMSGATIKLFAHIGSFSGSKEYVLACPTWTESQQYQLLAGVDEVVKTSGGFIIDVETNTLDTTYVVECNNSIFEINFENGRYYFEFPHGGQWSNGTYKIVIFAKQAGYLTSVTNEIEFVLNKLSAISDITVLRSQSDLSAVSLSWNGVAGATGYVFRMYDATDVNRENLLYEYIEERKTASTVVNTCTLLDIFGEGYQKLLEFGKVDAMSLLSDRNVFFDVFVRGADDVNDSDIYSFNAVIKGNIITVSEEKIDLYINQYGNIVFNCIAGETYIYRFVTAEGTVLQNWTRLDATSDSEKIDTSRITEQGGTYFNMEIAVVGSNLAEEVSTKLEGLVLDSIAFTTSGTGTTFVVGTDIVRVGYIESETNIDLSFEFVIGTYSRVFVGLSEDALINEQVVAINPLPIAPGAPGQEICNYKLSSIVDKLNEMGANIVAQNKDIRLYFWAYKETDLSERENSYTVSHFSTCDFTYTNNVDFVAIKKIGKELAESSKYMEDYANTFALFANNDNENKTTFGIYVKITPIGLSETDYALGEEIEGVATATSTVVFVSKEELQKPSYFHDEGFVINLTSIFENCEFASMSGKFKFEFSSLSVKTVDGVKQFVLSDWVSQSEGKQFEFTRLKNLDRLQLLSGSLTWVNNEENTTKYYIYFVEELDGNGGLSDNYTYAVISTNSKYPAYNASDFVGLGEGYYLAVRGVSEDPYVLPTAASFVTSNNEKIKVEKNEINTEIKIENGKIYIPFVEGDDDSHKLNGGDGKDFVDYIKNSAETGDAADLFVTTTFKVPFTFRLTELVSGQVRVRMRFTSLSGSSVGKAQTFDVDARQLISSLFEMKNDDFDYLQKLERMASRTPSGSATIRSLINTMQNGSFGIGNDKMLFDDRFEALQSGEYKLDYCLLGTSTTLTSGWYNYDNNGQNSIYVNNEPIVSAIKTSALGGKKSANAYKILLKKSEIFTKESGVLSGTLADRYIMKIYSDAGKAYSFSIAKMGTSFSLSLLGVEAGTSVSVYETDAFGNETTDGQYLLFYINQNDGDSILGRYGSLIEKTKYSLQIYAIGNDYSTSSKSSVFNLTLYGFGNNFAINNGEFTWTANRNSKTTVIYKMSKSSDETMLENPIEVGQSKFSLDGCGYGLYDYIDFLVLGDVYANNIFVDSEVYHVENIYKLANPTLKNTNGLIEIDDTRNATFENLDGCYSDNSLYSYRIENDISRAQADNGSEFIQVSDVNLAQNAIYYETGTTNLAQDAADYNYKLTESQASEFYVLSVGSSAEFEVFDNEDESMYYMKNIVYKNKTGVDFGEDATIGLAVKSDYSTLEAKMLDSVGGLNIKNGLLTWTAVSGRVEDGLQIAENERVVYKISVVQYDISYTDRMEVENEYPNTLEFYTLQTEFDFARIEEERLNKTAQFMKATIQAFAMNISTNIPAFPTYLPLVEGGYAYGNAKYADSTAYVLMGEGEVIKSIERSQSVDEGSIFVSDGKLTWTVTFNEPVDATAGFGDNYKFSVIDENFREIKGQYFFEQGMIDSQVRVTFIEAKGQILEKTQILSIYMTKLKSVNNVIKSFAREVEVTKLKTIDTNDYQIESDERDSNVEIIDFTNYFALNPANEIELSIYQNSDKSDVPSKIILTSKRSKFYVLGQEDSSITGSENGFAGKFVVGEKSRLILNFVVKNISMTNCLYSDVSDDIILQRSSWGDGQITWDDSTQKFTWTYNGFNALGEKVEASQVEWVNKTIVDAQIYVDEAMETEMLVDGQPFKIVSGQEIDVAKVVDDCTWIYYEGTLYYINTSTYAPSLKTIAEETLSAGTLYKVVDKVDDTTVLIETEDEKQYVIASNLVVEPVYIVEATYGEGASKIVRTYTTSEKEFIPTIIGKVTIKVRIKLGESNIQSQALEYKDSHDRVVTVDFNLFKSGYGTAQTPYLISNETEFKNMTYRMSKSKVLTKFTEGGNIKTEEEKYYFSIQNDITLSTALNGILFNGVFTGEIRGNRHILEYENSDISKFTVEDITVSEGNVVSSTDSSSTVISYGASIFENLSSTAVVKDLDLKVTLKKRNSWVSRNSMISGLTITNSGKIENVNLIEFTSDFVGYSGISTRIMMAYSGIASVNIGRDAIIAGCSMKTDMQFNDMNTAQLIFVGGIAFSNHATIDNCLSGDANSTKTISVTGLNESDVIQLAGIVVTNANYSTLTNCQNYANISASAQYGNENFVVYIAGIADYASGTVQDNQNHGKLTTSNVLDKNLHKGDIFANEA